MASELVDIVCKVRRDDPDKKAIAIVTGAEETLSSGAKREKWFWLPRSLITVNRHEGTVTVPRWLAEDKGLV